MEKWKGFQTGIGLFPPVLCVVMVALVLLNAVLVTFNLLRYPHPALKIHR